MIIMAISFDIISYVVSENWILSETRVYDFGP